MISGVEVSAIRHRFCDRARMGFTKELVLVFNGVRRYHVRDKHEDNDRERA